MADERVAPDRYRAALTFRFAPEEVGRLLRAHRLPYAVSEGPVALVLPLYRAGGELALWAEDNPWHAAWAELPASDALLPVIVPVGDLADITRIDARQAAAGARERLAEIGARYDAGEVVVAEAAVSRRAGGGPPRVNVTLRRYREGSVRIGGGTYGGGEGRSLEEILSAAAAATRTQLEDEWKEANLLRFGEEQSLVVDIPVKGLEDWLDIRRRLDALAFVREMALTALSTRFARVVLHYIGDTRQLSSALAHKGLELSREQDLWVLRRSASKRDRDVAREATGDAEAPAAE